MVCMICEPCLDYGSDSVSQVGPLRCSTLIIKGVSLISGPSDLPLIDLSGFILADRFTHTPSTKGRLVMSVCGYTYVFPM